MKKPFPFSREWLHFFISYHFLLQILLEPVSYLAKQMIAGIAARNAVITVRVPQGLEVLVCLNQRLSIFEGILRMHIVICQSVTDKQRTMLLLYPLDRVHLVTLLVSLGVRM